MQQKSGMPFDIPDFYQSGSTDGIRITLEAAVAASIAVAITAAAKQ